MAIKIIEVDLSEELRPIPVVNLSTSFRVLIRVKGQPVGWVTIPTSKKSFITTSQLHRAIQKQLSWQVVSQAFASTFVSSNSAAFSSEYISVVVCTRNRTKSLKTCLSFLQKLDYANYEIIIVDNAPDNNDTYKLVKNFNVRYVREEHPGLDWARNRGIEEAKYGLIAFTDDDVCVDPGWLKSIAEEFKNKEVMAVTGYVAPALLETRSQILFELSYGGMGHGFYRRVIHNDHISDQDLIRASNFGIGANMAFRKEVFDRIGKFDVALDVGTPSAGGGDIEIFHRVVMNGELLVYEPSVLVWHQHRENYEGLKKQIFNNGRSFGCYLITCYKKSNVRKRSIIKFLLVTWFYKWNFKNLVRSRFPKDLSIAELYGMLTSPFAYRKSQKFAKQVAERSYPNMSLPV